MGDDTNAKKRKGCLNPFKRGCLLFVYLPLLAGALIVYGIWYFENKTTRRKQAQVEADLERLSAVINEFAVSKGNFPKTLDELLQPAAYLSEIPVDPFSKAKEPYKYMNLNDGYLVVVYSVGKDGEDNYCNNDEYQEVHTDGRGDLEGLAACLQIERTKNDPNNGMSYFLRACLKTKTKFAGPGYQDLEMVAEDGWDWTWLSPPILRMFPGYNIPQATGPYPYTKNLQPNLAQVKQMIQDEQEALELLHEGASKPYNRSIHLDEDYGGGTYRIPDHLPASTLAKIARSKASYHIASNEYESAIKLLLDSIRFGQAIGHIDHLVSALYGQGIVQDAHESLQQILCRHELPAETLNQLLEKIKQLDADEPTLVNVFIQEERGMNAYYKRRGITESLELAKMVADGSVFGDPPQSFREATKTYIDAVVLWPVYKRRVISNTRAQAAAAALPYPKRTLFNYTYQSAFEKKPFMHRSRCAEREVSCWSTAAATKILIALQLYKLKYNSYPDTLEPLSEFLDPVPNDPFTEEPFMYEKSGRGYVLYSIGPELKDNFGQIAYDPTNGSTSPGDLLFH